MSSVNINSSTVIAACEKYIDFIKFRRAQEMARTLHYHAHKRRFLKKPLGYQGAFEFCELDGWYTLNGFPIRVKWSGQEDICNRLIFLAKYGDTVTVTDDFAFIFEDA